VSKSGPSRSAIDKPLSRAKIKLPTIEVEERFA
jgi:hypothetical protein